MNVGCPKHCKHPVIKDRLCSRGLNLPTGIEMNDIKLPRTGRPIIAIIASVKLVLKLRRDDRDNLRMFIFLH